MKRRMVQKLETRRILLVSHYFPTRAHAGGLRILDLYSKIKEGSPNTIIDLFSYERPEIDWSTRAAEGVFDNIYKSTTEELTLHEFKKVAPKSPNYDVVDIQFHQAGAYIVDYKTISNKVLYTPMECLSKCFYLNLRPKNLRDDKPSWANLKNQWVMAREEVRYARQADETICVSKLDAKFLRRVSLSKNITSLETGISEMEFPKAFSQNFKIASFDDRSLSILYIAYFGSQTNISALKWFLDYVHPLIKTEVEDYSLTVVGRGDLSMFESNVDNSVQLVGEVKSLEPYIMKARAGIAPALSGSGFRGKINQYGVYGLPCVASNLAVKGLAFTNKIDILTANTASKFAKGCVRLLIDKTLNHKIGQGARDRCFENYTWQSKWSQILEIYGLKK